MDSIGDIKDPAEIPAEEAMDNDGIDYMSDNKSQHDIRETRKDPIPERAKQPPMFVFDDLYIRKHWDGRLKVLELVTFLAAVLLPFHHSYYHTRFIFFRFIAWTAFVFVVIDLFLHLMSVWARLPSWITAPHVSMLLSALASISFCACSVLIVTVAKELKKETITLTSAFFGFASMILFGIESALHLLRWRASMPLPTETSY